MPKLTKTELRILQHLKDRGNRTVVEMIQDDKIGIIGTLLRSGLRLLTALGYVETAGKRENRKYPPGSKGLHSHKRSTVWQYRKGL